MFFLLGLAVGIAAFGESIDRFLTGFWNSSGMGRFTLDEWLNLPTGVVVLGVVVMALGLFWLVEKVERAMGAEAPDKKEKPFKLAGASVLLAAAVAVLLIGQPGPEERWQAVAPELESKLESREVQVDPGELLTYLYNDHVNVVLLDLRDESDYNLFHVQDARRTTLEELPKLAAGLLQKPANTLFVVMSNDEERATEAWKILKGQSLTNLYILAGGINNWLATFNSGTEYTADITPKDSAGADTLRYNFAAALGDQYVLAAPDPLEFELEYTPRVELELPPVVGGG